MEIGRLDLLIGKAKRFEIKHRFFRIDAENFRIVEIIGHNDNGIPDDILLKATPESFIKDPVLAELCRSAIITVNTTGVPVTLTLPITYGSETTIASVSFKKSDRYNEPNTIIAHATPAHLSPLRN